MGCAFVFRYSLRLKNRDLTTIFPWRGEGGLNINVENHLTQMQTLPPISRETTEAAGLQTAPSKRGLSIIRAHFRGEMGGLVLSISMPCYPSCTPQVFCRK